MCLFVQTVPSPSQICLGRTPQHRPAGPSHTKPSLQPPAQLCPPLSIGGGAELRRGAVCPGVGKRAAKQLFCSAGPRGWRLRSTSSLTGPPPPLTGHPQSQDQNGNHQGSKGLSVPGTPTLGPCLVVLISAYQGQENEASMSGNRPQVTLGGMGRDSNAGLFSSLTVHGSWPEREVI